MPSSKSGWGGICKQDYFFCVHKSEIMQIIHYVPFQKEFSIIQLLSGVMMLKFFCIRIVIQAVMYYIDKYSNKDIW